MQYIRKGRTPIWSGPQGDVVMVGRGSKPLLGIRENKGTTKSVSSSSDSVTMQSAQNRFGLTKSKTTSSHNCQGHASSTVLFLPPFNQSSSCLLFNRTWSLFGERFWWCICFIFDSLSGGFRQYGRPALRFSLVDQSLKWLRKTTCQSLA